MDIISFGIYFIQFMMVQNLNRAFAMCHSLPVTLRRDASSGGQQRCFLPLFPPAKKTISRRFFSLKKRYFLLFFS